MKSIRKVAVIGAGTMGSGIAAQFANAGVSCVLLDIVPPDLAGEAARDSAARSRFAIDALKRANKGKLKAFLEDSWSARVTPGNTEDHLDLIADCDWIVEAVTERIDVKRELFAKIASHRRSDAIVSSNTSGISASILTEGLDEAFRQHFVITHFFNPPRYLYLLEIVATPDTLPEVVETVERFADLRLGKGVVHCKDTPNFIGNRIGVHDMALCGHLTEDLGLSFEEVDAITGKAMGRPKSASFRLQDIVGIDVSLFVMENVKKLIPHDESLSTFEAPEFFKRLVAEKRLGRKTGAGFYKKEGKEILVLDRESFEYRPQRKVEFASLAAARRKKSVGARIKALVAGDDDAAQFAWKLISGTLCYSARRIPEISDDIISIDRAMRWGFAWELGPFEIWDAIGVGASVKRMESEGLDVPDNVKSMLAGGRKTFYTREGGARTYFDFSSASATLEPERAGVLILADRKPSSKPLRSNAAASVWDLGEGVLGVEFHSKMNTINGETLAMIDAAIEEAEHGDWNGVVIGNQGEHFCAGANLANLAGAARAKKWDAIDEMIRVFHRTVVRMRYSTKPVIVAPHGFALGGGCEVPLAGHGIQAAAETYMGLVELGVGLIPAGGGTRELACRAHESVPANVPGEIYPFVRRSFGNVGQALVSTSAEEARSFGYLRESDGVSMNRDRVLADARRRVLFLAEGGFKPPPTRDAVRVLGRPGVAEIEIELMQWREARFISEYDAFLGTKLAYVLCGGDIDDTQTVTERYLLDLEREIFLELCAQEKTLERIDHMLKTGRPLRN